MKTVVAFPDQQLLAEEAATWLIRLDADTPPTPDELKALGEWLHRSPAHREELEKLAALWGRMNLLTELAVPLGRHSRPAMRGRLERPAAARRSPWRWSGRLPALVAASFIVAVAIGVLARGPTADPMLASNGLYATAVGQQKTTTLADGSQVIMNTNSQLRVDYGRGYRRVVLLQGEALFTVAKNARWPFRVYAGDRRIEALGTAFSVYLDGMDINVTVTEGRVSLASVHPSPPAGTADGATKPLETAGSGPDLERELVEPLGTLAAGQVATIHSSAPEAAGEIGAVEITAPISADELAERMAWRDGILRFSGDRLEDVIKEVGRYTTMSIEIPEPAVRDTAVGGRFPVGEIDVMFSMLEDNFNLSVTRLGHNRAVISAADE